MSYRYRPVNPASEALADMDELRGKLISLPSPGASGYTRTWRLFVPVLKAERCVKCGICWLYCPEEVISWAPKQVPSIDYSYCKGCGICSNVCPTRAIEMEVEGE